MITLPWDSLFKELFQADSLTSAPLASNHMHEGLRTKFIKLERLKKQELSRWWDYTILQKYMENNQIPRGLRVILFPSFDDLSPDLLNEWEQLLITSSYGIMDILIRDAKAKRDKLLQDIAVVEKDINDIDSPDTKTKNFNNLKEVLHKHQLYIKDKKLRKLRRDDNDYKNGRVFTFARKYDSTKLDSNRESPMTKKNLSPSNLTTSDTDISSISSGTSEDTRDQTPLPSSTHRSPFLLELERFRRGQKQPQRREEETTRASGGGSTNTNTNRRPEGVATRSTARNAQQ
ncbi:hypothetical protein NDU88_001784 [Pleurodeles waltl]|uniref:Uncharacterized protein n=1 Tax=Pleurodeles waltl TaxID=8319 RepID=A0AAV7M231_PLEWA|nr:hypothetical protein NDU88_001784 [Pleurodeles waltl]